MRYPFVVIFTITFVLPKLYSNFFSMQIKWKNITGTDYKISSDGLIINSCGKILKCNGGDGRYKQTSLYYNKKPIKKLVHRLVAEHFIPNPSNLATVNHKNGNKNDNRVENLEWCSQKDNIRHAWDTGLSTTKYGQDKHTSVLDDMHILTIATLINHKPLTELAQYLPSRHGTSPSVKSKREQLRKIIKGERWGHLNYLFSNFKRLNPLSKLTESDVYCILEDAKSGKMSQSEISNKYNVSQSRVSAIARGASWKKVPRS